MTTKIILSYDGTDNDHDALALGRLLGKTGAVLELAYVRHLHEQSAAREDAAQREAEQLLAGGAQWLGMPDIPRHIVFSASTPEGLAELSRSEQAEVVAFGSEYRTAPGHVEPQASARRLLDGGPVAIAIAPSGFRDRDDVEIGTIAVVAEDGDASVRETAAALAGRLGATVASRPSEFVDFIVIGSKPGTPKGRVMISAAAEYLLETVRCPVLVTARDVTIRFEPPSPPTNAASAER